MSGIGGELKIMRKWLANGLLQGSHGAFVFFGIVFTVTAFSSLD
jgi:hypothetical protein